MGFERMIYEIYEEEMSKRENADYEKCDEQMKKLSEAYQFFSDIAEEQNGRVDPLRIVPKEEHCGVTAYFTLFYLNGDELQRFSKIVGDMSAISIDSLTDGTVCISFTIPNVFKKK